MRKAANTNTAPGREYVARRLFLGLLTSALLLASACQANPDSDEPQGKPPEDLTLCPEQRPEVCTQQYDPVCGVFQPGPRTDGQTSALEWLTGGAERAGRTATFGNACSACTKKAVIGYRPGECTEAAGD